ncbi:hypothetical protein BD779DRAFT_1519637 [Infundibulicybe gibba]|nr:hypothetical protein BD779DRAFT_1519637 [Infundibulicybe gibba]
MKGYMQDRYHVSPSIEYTTAILISNQRQLHVHLGLKHDSTPTQPTEPDEGLNDKPDPEKKQALPKKEQERRAVPAMRPRLFDARGQILTLGGGCAPVPGDAKNKAMPGTMMMYNVSAALRCRRVPRRPRCSWQTK